MLVFLLLKFLQFLKFSDLLTCVNQLCVKEWQQQHCGTSVQLYIKLSLQCAGSSLGVWHFGTCQGSRAPKGPRAAAVVAATDEGSMDQSI